MEGSRYPNGVLIDTTALSRTETTKSDNIKQNRVDITSRGIYSGGVITANGVTDTLIDITAFSGYAPNGEWIEETSATASVALADYTLGTVNVVYAMYTENATHNSPHESDGSTYPTFNEASYTLGVLTQADFDNTTVMPLTDGNLANEALDRALVIGKVTAAGAGVTLTTFSYSAEYEGLKYSNPIQLATLTGVTILAVDPDSPVGTTGSIRYNYSAPNYQFYWTSPGEAIGVVQSTAVDAELLLSDASGYWIRISVVVSQLPLGLVLPYDEAVTISSIYSQTVDRFTGEDVLHRSMQGTGILSLTNPHKTSLDDLEGESLSFLDEHQDIQHANGIWRGTSSSIFDPTISELPASGDSLTFYSTGPFYYVNGEKLTSVSPIEVLFNAANFTSGYLGASEVKEGTKFYEIYIDGTGTLLPHRRATYPTVRSVTGTWIIDMSADHPAGAYTLSFRVISAGGPLWYYLSWGDGKEVWGQFPGAGGAVGVVGRVVRAYAENGVDWVDVYLGDDTAAADQYLPQGIATHSDVVTVYASKDRDEYMQISSIAYWYSSRGNIGVPPTAALGTDRYAVDKRTWGNLDTDEMTTDALEDVSHLPNVEYNYSGIAIGRNSIYDFQCGISSGLTVNVNGGVFYCRGQRLEVDGSDFTLDATDTSLIWIDSSGTMQVSLYSATPFGSDLDDTLEWLIGHQNNMNEDAVTTYQGDGFPTPERGMPLWLVTTSGATATRIEGLYRGVGRNVDEWSVGQGGTITTPDMSASAAFSNLRVAFAYAKLEASSYQVTNQSITVKVVGDVILDTAIVQPEYVNVDGSGGTNSVITESAAVAAGSWSLANRCIVENVRIVGEGTTCFDLGDDCILRHISYTSITAGNYMLGSTNSATNALVEDCNISVKSGVFKAGGGGTFTNLRLEGNHIASATADTTGSLIDIANAEYAVISGNYFSRDQTTVGPAITLSDSDHALISDNKLESLGANKGTGIYLDTCVSCKVSGNVFDSDILVMFECGITLTDSSDNNTISNNTIYASSIGIFIEDGDSTLISNNKIYTVTATEQSEYQVESGSGYWGCFGILNIVTGTSTTILGNTILLGIAGSTLFSHSAGICMGRDAPDFSIVDNVVTLDYDNLSTAAEYVYCLIAQTPEGAWDISRNIIHNDLQAGVPAITYGFGILATFDGTPAARSEGMFNANTVFGSHSDITTAAGYNVADFQVAQSGGGGAATYRRRTTAINNVVKLWADTFASALVSEVVFPADNFNKQIYNIKENRAITSGNVTLVTW